MMRVSGIVTLGLIWFAHDSSAASEFRFCVFGENGSGAMRVLGSAELGKERARTHAEARFCEMTCGQVCAAIDFNERNCGLEAESTFDLTRAQSHYFCETDDGKSVSEQGFFATIRALVAPNYSGTNSSVATIVEAANSILTTNECPLHFQLDGAATPMPQAFIGLQIQDASTLKAVAQYPGSVKFVGAIGFCGSNPATLTLDSNGREVIKECTVPDYSTVLIADESPWKSAILLLRGYGHLAQMETDRRADLAYTLADPDLFIPSSPLLEGKADQFRVTKYQCVTLVKYAIQSEKITLSNSKKTP